MQVKGQDCYAERTSVHKKVKVKSLFYKWVQLSESIHNYRKYFSDPKGVTVITLCRDFLLCSHQSIQSRVPVPTEHHCHFFPHGCVFWDSHRSIRRDVELGVVVILIQDGDGNLFSDKMNLIAQAKHFV